MESQSTAGTTEPEESGEMVGKGSLKLSGVDDTWNAETPQRVKRRNPVTRFLSLLALGLVSFTLFLYLTFPYGVLKEVLSMQLTDAMEKSGYPIQVSIGSLRPHWFTGIQLGNVVVRNVTDPTAVLNFGEVTVRVGVFPLLIGNLSIYGRITQAGGWLETESRIGILSLIKGNPNVKDANVVFKNFALEPVFNHMLAIPRASKDPNMVLIQPILTKTTISGNMSGTVLFENNDKMTGNINLNLVNAFLLINDETLRIPQQNFSTAKIDMKYANNTLSFAEGTKFEAPDIGIGLSGNITLPEMPSASPQANLNLALSMHGQVEKNLGIIVPNLMRCKPLVNGELKAVMQGPLSNMSCN